MDILNRSRRAARRRWRRSARAMAAVRQGGWLVRPVPFAWLLLSLAGNGALLGLLLAASGDRLVLLAGQPSLASAGRAAAVDGAIVAAPRPAGDALGPRHKLNYEQWVALLGREAEAAARNAPPRLAVLAGDSLSLAFPPELLPEGMTWLNQGISGETSRGLLRRLSLLDRADPEVIFVMIGINDLLSGVGDDTVVANQRLMVQHLREAHPDAAIAIQSLLPHQAEDAIWEGRDRLERVPNDRIRALNRRLEIVAREENVAFLDLYPLFDDGRGRMNPALTTDGLHLNDWGYAVWRSALQVFVQLELPPETARSRRPDPARPEGYMPMTYLRHS